MNPPFDPDQKPIYSDEELEGQEAPKIVEDASTSTEEPESDNNMASISWKAIVGSFVALLLIILLVFLVFKCKKKKEGEPQKLNSAQNV
ncbi:hypothetical protein Ciccas_008915 [Cichlidogyrus casuarinus]|uniref:Uncharacterized protein n=1 Tax=Cichlidogyrus casuarinus TaxID=1844966 RepID=A0ABD2PYI9_9PLAT